MLAKPTILLLTDLEIGNEVIAAARAPAPLAGTGGAMTLHQAKERHSRMLRRRATGPALVGLKSDPASNTNSTNNPCKREEEAKAARQANAYNIKIVGSKGNVTVVSSQFVKGSGNSNAGTRQPLKVSSSSQRDPLAWSESSSSSSSSSPSSDSSSDSPSWSSDSWSSSEEPSQSSSSWSAEAPAASIGASFSTGTGSGMSVVTSWTGDDFLNWDYFTYDDPTHGNVKYVSLDDAKSSNLVGNDNGTFKMSVDTGSLIGGLRKSVRISSPTNWKKNQLVIADIAHLPEGCGTWPAFWSIGAKRAWPAGGEIDILEGVNDVSGNAYTLHTTEGCFLSGDSDATGMALTQDCQYQPGCTYKDKEDASYGPKLNAAGGGVYAAYFSNEGIKIWFWTRNNIPSSISSGSPDMASFGTPKANFGSSKCNMDTYFDDEQMLIINTTLMGDWAGATFWQNGCTGTLADAMSNGQSFSEAFWLVNSVKIYQ